MKPIYLYRYPDPTNPNRWIYVGQTRNKRHRDSHHRKGSTSFGRRFKVKFAGHQLPKPDYFEVFENPQNANFSEVVNIFKLHTWRGYGGMNLELPGFQNYAEFTKLAGAIAVQTGQLLRVASLGGKIGGKIAGKIAVETGQLKSVAHLGGKVSGSLTGDKAPWKKITGKLLGDRNAKSGLLIKALCQRWNINRGKICTCGDHKNV
jgi:hypothetical protein